MNITGNNYTEMDQYGYEDYDNQQALVHAGECQSERSGKLMKRLETTTGCSVFRKGRFPVYDGRRRGGTIFTSVSEILQRAWRIATHLRLESPGEQPVL